MEEAYDFKKVEPRVSRLWEKENYFSPRVDHSRKRYSAYLIPPNASGPLHVGNALMIAIQDILVRHHRAKGEPTLWIPSTDHGGYETQVTFEQELEKKGQDKSDLDHRELYKAISAFVEKNNKTIVGQIKSMGASVDWSRFRFTLDESSLAFVQKMFEKMVGDDLIYRSSNMVNYCTSCATVLADVELKEVETASPLYFIKFPLKDGDDYLSLATTRPEFIFATTHVLVHPQDTRFAHHIGSVLTNPITGEEVQVIASKRKFDPKNPEPFLPVFSPSSKRYDFEYALRHKLPVQDLFDWGGALVEGYPGLKPEEARKKELDFLQAKDAVESVDSSYIEPTFLCKKGHAIQPIIRMTWFLKFDDERAPLRKPALEALQKKELIIQPHWREKGLTEWTQKMHDWPIARQNVWGIKIPLWYEITDPTLFTVWFLDTNGSRRSGNLQTLFEEGISLDEIVNGLERVYAAEGSPWTLTPEGGKSYLPETDTFDTWFSSGVWGAMVFDSEAFSDKSYFYPSDAVVIGHDLLRLCISREIILGRYLTGQLPFKRVYFHSLLKSKDGQKMSKSLGNAVTLDDYLNKYGADVTRMALVSYTATQEDFYFADERLELFKKFSSRLWTMGRVSEIVHTYKVLPPRPEQNSAEDLRLVADAEALVRTVGGDIERYFVAQAQEKATLFLSKLEQYVQKIFLREDDAHALGVFDQVFKKYLLLLHPFMPFMTEEAFGSLYKPERPLAATLLNLSRTR